MGNSEINRTTGEESVRKAPDPGQWLRKQTEATSSGAVNPDSTPHAEHPPEQIDPTQTPDNLLQPAAKAKRSLWARMRSNTDQSPTPEPKPNKRSLTDPLKGGKGSSPFLSAGIRAFLELGNPSEPKQADLSQSRQPSPSPRRELHSPDISASSAVTPDRQFKTEPTRIGPQERNRPNEILTAMPVQEEVPGLGRVERTEPHDNQGLGRVERTEPHDNQVSPEVISQQLSGHAARWKETTRKVNKLKDQLEYTQQKQKNILHEWEKYPEYNRHTAADWQKRYDRVEQLEHEYTTASPGAQKREYALFDLEKEFNIESGTATEETFKSKKREIKLGIDARIEMLGDSKGKARLWSKCIEEKVSIQTQLAAEMKESNSILTEYQDVLKQYHPVSPSHTSSREVLSPTQQQAFPVEPNPNELDVLAQVKTRQESRSNELREKEAKVAADENVYYTITGSLQKAEEDYGSKIQKLTEKGTSANPSKISDTTQEHRNTIISLTTTWKERFGLARDQSLQKAIETGEIPERIRERKEERTRERNDLQAEIQSRRARESFLQEHMRENPEVGAQPIIDLSFGRVDSIEQESILHVSESSQRLRGETSSQEEAATRERVIQPGELEDLNTQIRRLDTSLNELKQATTAIDEQIKALPDIMTNSLGDSNASLNAAEKHISSYDDMSEELNTIREKEEAIRGRISELEERRTQPPFDQYNEIGPSLQRQYDNLAQWQVPRKEIRVQWSSWKEDDANAQYSFVNARLDNNSNFEDEIRDAFFLVEDGRKYLSARRVDWQQAIESEKARLQERRSQNESTRNKTLEEYKQALYDRGRLLSIQEIQNRQRGMIATDNQEGATTIALRGAAERKKLLSQQHTEITARLAEIDTELSALREKEISRDKDRRSFVAQKVTLTEQRETIGKFERQYKDLSEKLSACEARIADYGQKIRIVQDTSSRKLISRGTAETIENLRVPEQEAREEKTRLNEAIGTLNNDWNRQFRSRETVRLNADIFKPKRVSLDRRLGDLNQEIHLSDISAGYYRQKIAEFEKSQKTALSDLKEIETKLNVVSAEYNMAEIRTSIAKSQDTHAADDQELSRERPSIEAIKKNSLEEFGGFAAGQKERAQEIEKLLPTHEDFVNLTRAREDLQNREQEERRSEQQVQELAKREKELLARKSDLDDKRSNWETRMQAFEARKDEDRTVTEYDSLIHEGDQWRESNLRYPQDKRALERDWVQPLATQKKVRGERAFASKNYEETKKVISEKLEQTEREIQQQLQSLETRLTALNKEFESDQLYLKGWDKVYSEQLNEAYSASIKREQTALTARQREHERAQALVEAQEGDILAAEFRRLETRQKQLDISRQEIESDRAHLTKRINDWNTFSEEGKSKSINEKTWQANFSQRWVDWKNAERAPQEPLHTLKPGLSPIRNAVIAENGLLRDRSTKWQERFDNHQKDTQQLAHERAALTARQREHEHAQALVEAQEGDILTDKLRRLEVWESKLDATKQAIENDKGALSLQARIEKYNAFEQEFQENKRKQDDISERWVNWKMAELKPEEEPYRLEAGQSLQTALEQEKATLAAWRKESGVEREVTARELEDTERHLRTERDGLAARQRELERAQALVKAHEAEFQSLETRQEQLDASEQAIESDQKYLAGRIRRFNEFVDEDKSASIAQSVISSSEFSQSWVAWKNEEHAPQGQLYTLEPEPSLIKEAVATEDKLLQGRSEKLQARLSTHKKDTQQLKQDRAALAARQSELEQAQAFVKAHEGDTLVAEFQSLETRESDLQAARRAFEEDPKYAILLDRTERYNKVEQEFQKNKQRQADFAQRWDNWKNAERDPHADQSLQTALEQERAELDTRRKALEAELLKASHQNAHNKDLLHRERAQLLARQSQLERESGVARDGDMQADSPPHEQPTAQEAPQGPVQSSLVEYQPESSMTPRETQGSGPENVAQGAEAIRELQARLASIRKELPPTLMQQEEEFQQKHRIAADSEKALDSEQGELRNAYRHLNARQVIYDEVQIQFATVISTEPRDQQKQLEELNRRWEERKINSPILRENVQSQGKGKELAPATTFTDGFEAERVLLGGEDQELQKRSLSINQRYQGWQEQQEIIKEQQATSIASVTNKDHQAKLQEYSDVLTALRKHEASLEIQTQNENEANVADVPPSPIHSPGSEAEASRSSMLENLQSRAPREDANTERPAILEAENATPIERLKALKEQIQALPEDVQKWAKREEELQQQGQQLDIRRRELDSAEERIKADLQNWEQKRLTNNDIQIEVESHLGLENIKGTIIPDGRNEITEKWVRTFGEKDREPFQDVFSQEAGKSSSFIDNTFTLLAQQKSAIVIEQQSVANDKKKWQSQYDAIKRRLGRNANKRNLVQASHKDILDEHLSLLTTLRSQNLLEQPASGMLHQLSSGAAGTLQRSIGTIRQQQAERPPDPDPDPEQAERLPDPEMYF